MEFVLKSYSKIKDFEDQAGNSTRTIYFPMSRVNGLEIVSRKGWWISNFRNNAKDRILHRLDGPAYIQYNIKGEITEALWFVYGVYIDALRLKKIFGENISIPLTYEQQVELALTVR